MFGRFGVVGDLRPLRSLGSLGSLRTLGVWGALVALGFLRGIWTLVIVFGLCVGLSGCGSAKRVYVPVERAVSVVDTVYLLRVQADTVRERDSVAVIQRGDTVYQTRWQLKERVRLRHDTVYLSHLDTMLVERPIPVASVSKPSFVQRAKDWLFLPLVLVCVVLLYVLKRRR